MVLPTVIAETVDQIEALDGSAMALARTHLDSLTKPVGSLGRLEELAVWLAGVTGDVQPSFPRKTVVVAVADHGVAGAGVSAYPSEVTEAMLHNFLKAGAAINVMARAQGASVLVVDAGVLEDVRDAGRAGTGVSAAATRFLVAADWGGDVGHARGAGDDEGAGGGGGGGGDRGCARAAGAGIGRCGDGGYGNWEYDVGGGDYVGAGGGGGERGGRSGDGVGRGGVRAESGGGGGGTGEKRAGWVGWVGRSVEGGWVRDWDAGWG